MAKINERYLADYYRKLIACDIENNLNNETLGDRILQEYLAVVPQKLYKYRECNKNNFGVLEKQQIWMPAAKDFYDQFDSTINIDFGKNYIKLRKWFLDNISEITYYTLKNYYEKNGVKFDVSIGKVKWFKDNFYTSEGRLLELKARAYMQQEKMNVKQYEDALEKIELYLSSNEENLQRIVKKLFDELMSTSRTEREHRLVYSLTEERNNPAMWEHYADKYRGYCIEYDMSKDRVYDNRKNLLFLLPIIYKKRIPYYDIVSLMDVAAREHIFGEIISKNEKMLEEQIKLNLQLLYKKKDYDYEKEWRLCIKNKNNNLQPFPFVSAIYMGKDISAKNQAKLESIARELNVEIYKQRMPLCGNEFVYDILN